MKKIIKVLFLTYPRIGLNRGGLQIQIEKTAEALAHTGVEVVLYDPWKNQLPEVDLCHVFSLDGTLVYHVQRAVDIDVPVVISPVFNNFSGKAWQIKFKAELTKYIPGMYSDLKRGGEILSLASRILALNEDEAKLLADTFSLPTRKLEVVPNGLDPKFGAGDPSLFENRYSVKDFVLQVASIEHRKNQLNLIRAMKSLPYKLVLIGQAMSANYEYVAECKALSGDRVIFVGQLNHKDPLLASAFSAAKLFVLPSYSEVMPLTLYEAAMAGCKLAISRNIPISKSIEQLVPVFDPDDIEQMAAVIDNEMKAARNKALREKVRSMPTWQDVGSQIRRIYDNVITTGRFKDSA